MTDLDPAELESYGAAHDDCIPGAALAKDFTDGVFSELAAEPAEGIVECVGTALDGSTGALILEGAAAADTGALPETGLAAVDACVGPEIVSQALQAEFTEQGLEAQQR